MAKNTQVIELQVKETGTKKVAQEFSKLEKELMDMAQAIKKATPEVKKLTNAEKQAAAAAGKLKQKTDKVGFGMHSMRVQTAGLRRKLGELRNVLLVVTFAFAGMIRAMNNAIEAYKRQWQAEQKLFAAMSNVKTNVKGSTQALINYAAAMQKVTTFSDENIIGGMAMLSTFQLNAEAIKEITPRLLDMAAAAQIAGGEEMELHQIANALGKGITGQVGILSKYGVKFDEMELATARASGTTAEFNYILKALDGNFKGIAQQLATSTIGQIIQFEMAIGDASEQIGKASLPIKKWWTEIKLVGTEFLATMAIVKMNSGEWDFKSISTMIEMWKEARRQLKEISETEFIGAGGFQLTEDQTLQLANLQKAYQKVIAEQKLKAVQDDGLIDQSEQYFLAMIKVNFIEGLRARGLLELTDGLTQYYNAVADVQQIIHQSSDQEKFQIENITALGNALAQAAIDGKNMGKAVVNAIKSIAQQILAQIAIFLLAKAIGLDLSLLMGGSQTGKFVGANFFGQGGRTSIANNAPTPVGSVQSAPQVVNQNTFLILDDQQGYQLQQVLNRVSANQ